MDKNIPENWAGALMNDCQELVRKKYGITVPREELSFSLIVDAMDMGVEI